MGGGGIAQLVSHPPLILGTRVWIPVGALDHINAWMRGEEITSCKSHIATVSLTKKTKKNTVRVELTLSALQRYCLMRRSRLAHNARLNGPISDNKVCLSLRFLNACTWNEAMSCNSSNLGFSLCFIGLTSASGLASSSLSSVFWLFSVGCWVPFSSLYSASSSFSSSAI